MPNMGAIIKLHNAQVYEARRVTKLGTATITNQTNTPVKESALPVHGIVYKATMNTNNATTPKIGL